MARRVGMLGEHRFDASEGSLRRAEARLDDLRGSAAELARLLEPNKVTWLDVPNLEWEVSPILDTTVPIQDNVVKFTDLTKVPVGERTLWCGEGGCDAGLLVDPSRRDPNVPFGGFGASGAVGSEVRETSAMLGCRRGGGSSAAATCAAIPRSTPPCTCPTRLPRCGATLTLNCALPSLAFGMPHQK